MGSNVAFNRVLGDSENESLSTDNRKGLAEGLAPFADQTRIGTVLGNERDSMSEKKVAFILIYDHDDGSSESFSAFYTKIEAFETKVLREARIAYLKSRDRELHFLTRDLEMLADPNQHYEVYGEDEDDEDF